MKTIDIHGTCEECERFGPTEIVPVDFHGRLTWIELCVEHAATARRVTQREDSRANAAIDELTNGGRE